MSNRCQECGGNDYLGRCNCGRSPEDIEEIEELSDRIADVSTKLAHATNALEEIIALDGKFGCESVDEAREALAKIRDGKPVLPDTGKLAEDLHAVLRHALDLDYFSEGGSTRGWAEDACSAWEKAHPEKAGTP